MSAFTANYAASESSPTRELLQDQSGARNAIRLDCSQNYKRQELTCRFVQFTVSYETNPDELDLVIQAEIESVDETDPQELLKELKESCPMPEREEAEQVLKNIPGGERKVMAELILNSLQDICKANDAPSVKALLKEIIIAGKRFETMTCTVWPNIWEEVFKYRDTAEDGYWISTEDVSGECGVVNVSTLKKDRYSWKYDSQRLVTNRDKSDGLLTCADVEERKVSYSVSTKTHDVNCKQIKFAWFP
jgi:hypothetical protein